MTPRFAVEEGRFGNACLVVDLKQPSPNGPKIVATCSSSVWANNIAEALNHMVLDRGVEYDTSPSSSTT